MLVTGVFCKRHARFFVSFPRSGVGTEIILTRIIHSLGFFNTECEKLTRSASDGNLFAIPRLRFGLV
jgi:hypothetical protein